METYGAVAAFNRSAGDLIRGGRVTGLADAACEDAGPDPVQQESRHLNPLAAAARHVTTLLRVRGDLQPADVTLTHRRRLEQARLGWLCAEFGEQCADALVDVVAHGPDFEECRGEQGSRGRFGFALPCTAAAIDDGRSVSDRVGAARREVIVNAARPPELRHWVGS